MHETDDDTILCIGAHPTPVSLAGGEDDLEDLAVAAGWIETDDGWYCPDAAHDGVGLTTYTIIPLLAPNDGAGHAEEDESVTYTSLSDAMVEFADLLERTREAGGDTLTLSVELGRATLGELRE